MTEVTQACLTLAQEGLSVAVSEDGKIEKHEVARGDELKQVRVSMKWGRGRFEVFLPPTLRTLRSELAEYLEQYEGQVKPDQAVVLRTMSELTLTEAAILSNRATAPMTTRTREALRDAVRWIAEKRMADRHPRVNIHAITDMSLAGRCRRSGELRCSHDLSLFTLSAVEPIVTLRNLHADELRHLLGPWLFAFEVPHLYQLARRLFVNALCVSETLSAVGLTMDIPSSTKTLMRTMVEQGRTLVDQLAAPEEEHKFSLPPTLAGEGHDQDMWMMMQPRLAQEPVYSHDFIGHWCDRKMCEECELGQCANYPKDDQTTRREVHWFRLFNGVKGNEHVHYWEWKRRRIEEILVTYEVSSFYSFPLTLPTEREAFRLVFFAATTFEMVDDHGAYAVYPFIGTTTRTGESHYLIGKEWQHPTLVQDLPALRLPKGIVGSSLAKGSFLPHPARTEYYTVSCPVTSEHVRQFRQVRCSEDLWLALVMHCDRAKDRLCHLIELLIHMPDMWDKRAPLDYLFDPLSLGPTPVPPVPLAVSMALQVAQKRKAADLPVPPPQGGKRIRTV